MRWRASEFATVGARVTMVEFEVSHTTREQKKKNRTPFEDGGPVLGTNYLDFECCLQNGNAALKGMVYEHRRCRCFFHAASS